MKIFVTGTDTGIGKTIVSAWLALHFDMHYWKPIQAGTEGMDSDTVRSLTRCGSSKLIPERYVLKRPLSPHLAAQLEETHMRIEDFILPEQNPLIVEGAGGLMVPINDKHTMLDLIKKLAIPVLVVARSALGTINHTCLTVHALRDSNIPIMGVIMNGEKNEGNKQAIERYAKTKVLYELEPFETIDHSSLRKVFPSEILISKVQHECEAI